MPKYYPVTVVRRVVEYLGNVVNFPAIVNAGVTVGNRIILVAGNLLLVGIQVALSPFSVAARQDLGLLVERGFHTLVSAPVPNTVGVAILLAFQRFAAVVLNTLGLDVTKAFQDITAVRTHANTPAMEIVQSSITLSHASWVTSATESPASDWDNLANSEGSSTSTATSSLEEGLILVQGTLYGNFAAQANRDPLAITGVRLRCYFQVAEFLLAGSLLTISYRVGALGTAVQLDQYSGGIITVTNVDYLSDGLEFDITASGPNGLGAAWTWDDLTDLRIEYQGTILVDAGLSVVHVNATKLEIDASHTESH